MLNHFCIDPNTTELFNIKEEILMYSKENVMMDYSINLVVELDNLKTTPYYHIFSWKYVDVEFSEDIVSGFPFRKIFLELYKGFEIIYRVDTAGIFKKIENFSAIYEAFDDTLWYIMEKSGLMESDSDIVLAKKSFERRQLVEKMHIPEILLLHFPYTATYQPDKKTEQHIALPTGSTEPLFGKEISEHKTYDNTEELVINRIFTKQPVDKCIHIFPELETAFNSYMEYFNLKQNGFNNEELYHIRKGKTDSWINSMKYERTSTQNNFYKRKKMLLDRITL